VAEARANYKKFWKDLKSGRFVEMVREASKGESVSNSIDIFNIMKPVFGDCPDVEVVYCIFLDAQNRILAIEKLFSGTITNAIIYPRELIKQMLSLNATALVMVHNHPSGCSQPSPEDISITQKVFVALASIDAILHDHVIVGDRPYSLADEGFIKKFKTKYARLLRG